MQYEGTLYRPPSEAYSLIIQVTIGCAHNRCTFCNMYREKKFRVRTREEIMGDLDECRDYYGDRVRRVFLTTFIKIFLMWNGFLLMEQQRMC